MSHLLVLALRFLLADDKRYPRGGDEAVGDHHENRHAERVEPGIDVLLVRGTCTKTKWKQKEEDASKIPPENRPKHMKKGTEDTSKIICGLLYFSTREYIDKRIT